MSANLHSAYKLITRRRRIYVFKSRIWENEKLNYANQFLPLCNFINIFRTPRIRTAVLSLGFSLNTSLFPEGFISLFHFRLIFPFEVGDNETCRKICTIYPARDVHCHLAVDMEIVLYTLWSITTHLKPACVALRAQYCFVTDSNATISSFSFFFHWKLGQPTVGYIICLGLRDCSLTRVLALCKPSPTILLNINYGPLCNRASSARSRADQYVRDSTPLAAFRKLDLSTIHGLCNRRDFVLPAIIEAI